MKRRILTLFPLALLWMAPVYVQAGFEEGLEAARAGDHQSAFEQFQQAAEAGDPRAFGKLGAMYLYGAGTETDYGKAYAWLDLAVRAGEKQASGFRDTAAGQMTQEEQEAAKKLADELSEKYPGTGSAGEE